MQCYIDQSRQLWLEYHWIEYHQLTKHNRYISLVPRRLDRWGHIRNRRGRLGTRLGIYKNFDLWWRHRHRLIKRQSLSTTVLTFRTILFLTILFHLLTTRFLSDKILWCQDSKNVYIVHLKANEIPVCIQLSGTWSLVLLTFLSWICSQPCYSGTGHNFFRWTKGSRFNCCQTNVLIWKEQGVDLTSRCIYKYSYHENCKFHWILLFLRSGLFVFSR